MEEEEWIPQLVEEGDSDDSESDFDEADLAWVCSSVSMYKTELNAYAKQRSNDPKRRTFTVVLCCPLVRQICRTS